MFEREIKFIYDFNLNKVNRLGPYFTFEQLTSAEIHPAILNYISAEIDYLIFEDRQNLLKNSMFDYSGEKISNYFSQISEEVKRSKRFSQEYIAKLILHASSFNINFLARPKWTLQKFVFDEGNHKTTLEIKQILGYIYYYQYLKKILISYINSKKILSMNSSEFGELLDKVENLGNEIYLQSIISNALKSLSDFFNIGEVQKNKIPFAAVESFLEEKQLNKHLKKIKDHFKDDKALKYFVHDYQKVLDSVMIEKYETISHEAAESEEEIIVEQIEAIESIDETVTESNQEDKLEIIDEEKVLSIAEEIDEENITRSDLLYDEEKEELTIDNNETDETEEHIEEKHEKPRKFRIRIDKENKTEPVIEDIDDTQDDLIEQFKEEIEESIYQQNSDKTEIQDEAEETIQQYDEVNTEDIEDISDDENELEVEESEYEKNEDEDDESIGMLESIIRSKEEVEKKEELDENERYQKEESQKLDIAELLEHKDMTKIIEVIFDYDIEEFASTLDEISNCQYLDDAYVIINQALKNHNINRNSKEAESFKKIISEYFGRT